MIYITGDTHNTIDMHNASAKQMRRYCGLQNVDYKDINYLIVLGDFGFPWFECPIDEDGIHPTDKNDKYLLKWYKEKPFTVLAVMGNHDNYNMLEKLPEVEMFGDKVLKVSDNIFYLKRGHYYEIEGKSFLVLGGAQSHDKYLRKADIDWWKQEEWTTKEQLDCLNLIKEHGNKADYVLSHTGPIDGISCIESSIDAQAAESGVLNNFYSCRQSEAMHAECRKEFMEDTTVRLNTEIDSFLEYKKWFFGHWHKDWGYDHREESRYIPLYHEGVVV